jgi:hypothetical protein
MTAAEAQQSRPHCSTPPDPPLELPASMPLGRQRALMVGSSKWVNGTVLHYAFFGADQNPAWAPADEAQKQVVRQSFQQWKDIGLGLEFQEVDDLAEAEVRISFDQSDGSWSYIGRGILQQPLTGPTANFGWRLDTPYGHTTALHEIGHTLGMPHEHQSPFSGIVWNEEAVYQSFSGPPNNWPRQQIRQNVLQKLMPAQVEGSRWDADSIMEYIFDGGLIDVPAQYRDGIHPPGTISPLDVEWMRSWYPGGQPAPRPLQPFQSVPLTLAPKQQADFAIEPPSSRRYEIATFGTADTVIVLFEDHRGRLRYVAGDDDGGEDRNAHLSVKLAKGRRYVLRVRLYWAGGSGQTAVMYW